MAFEDTLTYRLTGQVTVTHSADSTAAAAVAVRADRRGLYTRAGRQASSHSSWVEREWCAALRCATEGPAHRQAQSGCRPTRRQCALELRAAPSCGDATWIGRAAACILQKVTQFCTNACMVTEEDLGSVHARPTVEALFGRGASLRIIPAMEEEQAPSPRRLYPHIRWC